MNTRDRLVQCFEAVFPSVTAAEAEQASRDTLETWDSLAGITLMSVVQEEFGVEVDLLEWANLESFAAIESYVQELLPQESR